MTSSRPPGDDVFIYMHVYTTSTERGAHSRDFAVPARVSSSVGTFLLADRAFASTASACCGAWGRARRG